MNDEQKRAFLAVILSGVILFGWQFFFAPKINPNQQQQNLSGKSEQTIPSDYNGNEKNIESNGGALSQKNDINELNQNVVTTETLDFENKYKFTLNSRLSLLDIKNVNEKFSFNSILEADKPLEILFYDGNKFIPLNFKFEKSLPHIIKGYSNELDVSFKGEIQENGKLRFSFSSSQATKLRFIIHTKPKTISHRTPKEFVLLSDGVDRLTVGEKDTEEKLALWFGIDFNYHLFAISFPEKKPITYTSTEEGDILVDTHQLSRDWSGNILYVKKNYDELVDMGENLKLAVDFGILGVLAVPILKALQFLYGFIPNYGVAIIILTIFMKILTFPLQNKSYKSMKKMQVIQPELTKIREQFKDDPQRMQKESMELFKKAGANPLSGCFPLLLQTPIFFAFYKVLDGAVELVGAPFFGWINDLSLKDPFYILPIVMALIMFLQQKMTPNTSTDPTQKKVMMLMPFIFGLIMKDLPSGLTLYILVSTVCGILQQMFVFKYSS